MTSSAKLDSGMSAALRAWSENPETAPDAGISVNLLFSGDIAAIQALGFEPHSVVGDQALGIVRFKDVPRLVQHDDVLWIAAGRTPKKSLDTATRDVRARATAPIAGPPVDGVWHAAVNSGALTSVPKATGKGVIVAVMDTGIDYSHPMFLSQQSPRKTRILKIWDQGLIPTSIAECPDAPKYLASAETYGVEYDSAKIDAALNGGPPIRHKDCDGHGTHVAGIAAGGTHFTPLFGDASKVGVAPEADIIAVKVLDNPEKIFFRHADLSAGDEVKWAAQFRDAVLYCLRTAHELNKPIVINMSLGDIALPGDGLDDDARWLDAVLDPTHAQDDLHFPKGAIVAKAAGNDGFIESLPQAKRIVVPASGEIVVPLMLLDDREEAQTTWKDCKQRRHKPDIGVHFWYRRTPAPLAAQFAIRLPHGGIFGSDVMVGAKHELGFRPIAGPPPNDIAVPFGPAVHRFTIDHQDNPPAPHPAGGTVRRQYVHFFVSPKESGGTISYHPGIYEMRIKAPAGTEIFAMCDSEFWGGGGKSVMFAIASVLQDGSSALTANMPPLTERSISDSGGRHVITVAAYDDSNGDATQLKFRTMADFSSRGPMRDFSDPASPLSVVPKPDISAPGVAVNSAESYDVEGLIHWPWWYFGDRFQELQGTSMASPMVAGAVALLLQKKPTLNSTEVRTRLAVTTRKPGETPPFQWDITLPPLPSPGPAPAGACGAGMLDVLASHKLP